MVGFRKEVMQPVMTTPTQFKEKRNRIRTTIEAE